MSGAYIVSRMRRATVERITKETQIRLSLDLDGTGVRKIAHAAAVLQPHARHRRAPRPVRPGPAGARRRRGRRPPHGRGRRHLPGPGLQAGAGRQARASPASATATIPMDETLVQRRRSTSAAGRRSSTRPTALKRALDRGLRRRAGARVLRRLRQHGPVQPAPRGPLRRERPPHRRGAVQGVRPRRPGGGDGRPARGRRAVDQGHADRVSARRPRVAVAIVDTGSGNLRSVEKALAAGGRRPGVTSDPDAVAGGRQGGRARAGRVRRLRGRPGPGRRGAARGGARGDPGGQAVPRDLPGPAGPVRGQRRGARLSPAWGSCPAACARFQPPPPLKVPHMGWNECRRGSGGGTRGARAGRRTGRTSTSCTATTRRRRERRRGAVYGATAGVLRGGAPATTCSPASSTPRRARRPGLRCCGASSRRDCSPRPMLVFPAIDLLGGAPSAWSRAGATAPRSTRDEPWELAEALRRARAPRGCTWSIWTPPSPPGKENNHATIERILAASPVEVEVGGGLRTLADCERLFALGARYAVLGTAAIKIPRAGRTRPAGAFPGGSSWRSTRAAAWWRSRAGRRPPPWTPLELAEAAARAGAGGRALHRHRPRRHAHRARPGGHRPAGPSGCAPAR